jgi:outer membrane protein OmpA-like peptidoglycan-associated protein
LLIVGYTDSTGDVGINVGVARDRASGIARALGHALPPDLRRVRMSAIWRGEEVNSVEHPAGVPLRNPSSRRADVFHCIPDR